MFFDDDDDYDDDDVLVHVCPLNVSLKLSHSKTFILHLP